VAHLLLDHRADVNFIDSSQINKWNAPVPDACERQVIQERADCTIAELGQFHGRSARWNSFRLSIPWHPDPSTRDHQENYPDANQRNVPTEVPEHRGQC